MGSTRYNGYSMDRPCVYIPTTKTKRRVMRKFASFYKDNQTLTIMFLIGLLWVIGIIMCVYIGLSGSKLLNPNIVFFASVLSYVYNFPVGLAFWGKYLDYTPKKPSNRGI